MPNWYTGLGNAFLFLNVTAYWTHDNFILWHITIIDKSFYAVNGFSEFSELANQIR